MSNKPTKRVGPGGVQRVEESHYMDASRYLGAHEHESRKRKPTGEQQVIVRIMIETEPDHQDTRFSRLICRIIATLTIRVEFCVDMVWGFALISVYQFEAPYDDRTEQRAKCDIKSGRALYDNRREINPEPHFDRNKPFTVIIEDPSDILRWLGADFAASMAKEQQQLPPDTKLLT